jgi:hypothetical protein
MILSFGKKHAGKSLELLVLKEPDYIKWMLEQKNPGAAMKRAQDEAKRLIAKFDAMPFTENCSGHTGSPHPATRCTVYGNNVRGPYWWCDACNPYQSGANPGKLQEVRSYGQALRHVASFCGGRVSDYKSLIRDLAAAKGLPSRVGEKQAQAFFG